MKPSPATNHSLSRRQTSNFVSTILAAVALTTACSFAVRAATPLPYTIVDLGRAPAVYDAYGNLTLSYGNVFPTAINNQGQVTGNVEVDSSDFYGLGIYNVRHPFLWETGVIADLAPQSGLSLAFGINDAGTVVGDNDNVAVVWQNGQRILLDAQESQTGSGRAINQLGHVTGYSAGRAVIWHDGLKTDLGIDGFYSTGINDADQVCGQLSTADFYGAIVWQAGVITPIPALGSDAGYVETDAYDINSAGQVVGLSSHSDNTYHAFIWQNGAIDLGVLGVSLTSFTESAATAINDLGQVVGQSTTAADGNPHGFLWKDANGNGASDPHEMVDLNALLPADSEWEIITATGINSSGQIVGFGIFAGAAGGSGGSGGKLLCSLSR